MEIILRCNRALDGEQADRDTRELSLVHVDRQGMPLDPANVQSANFSAVVFGDLGKEIQRGSYVKLSLQVFTGDIPE